jgi:serine phosphatase RsbU (regulator of sigma subunit)
VLLYTDGLVERRGQSLDVGLGRLQETLAELADLPLDQLCDALLDRLLPRTRDDDVAMVAVRLHAQDAPRPPEAGPERVPVDGSPDGR